VEVPVRGKGLCDVLIVEDSGVQCVEMAGFLARAELAVETAADGASGLSQARLLRPTVVLLDYNLPDMNGVQLAQQIRAMLPRAAIILMSGRIDGLSEKILADIGISVFLNKPVPLAPLRQAVAKLVQEGGRGREAAGTPGWINTGLGGTRD
jgi:DNA-binding response OmpR family regulator